MLASCEAFNYKSFVFEIISLGRADYDRRYRTTTVQINRYDVHRFLLL